MTQRDGAPRPTVAARPMGRSGIPKLTIAALALLVAGLGVISSVGRPRRRPPPMPQKTVDLDRYLGRWYEFARYDSWFERKTEAVTADYSRRPDGSIRIVNAGHGGSPSGPLRWTEGKARIVPNSGHAKLKVAFFGPFFLGDYWILDRGDDYDWSIVGGGSRRYLWILTRVAVPPPDVQAMLIARAMALGYETATLHRTQHPAA